MRRPVFAWILIAFLCSSHVDVAAARGANDGVCTSATYLTPGTYTGLTTWGSWGFGAPMPGVNYFYDEDWTRFTVPPGQKFDVYFQTTSVTTGGQYTGHGIAMRLFEFSTTSCQGTELPSGTNHVAAINSTASPKDYVLSVSAQVTWMNQSVFVNYDLFVQASTAQTGVAYCPGAPNSTGVGGTLAVQGTTSVSANDLVYDAAQLPANGFALLADSTSQASWPFGDGTLCLGALLRRLYVVPVSGGGTCSVALDIPNLPAGATIATGDLRYFQLYYRDSFGPLGTGFNLTNALAVTFTP